jgi:hypothetical protein
VLQRPVESTTLSGRRAIDLRHCRDLTGSGYKVVFLRPSCLARCDEQATWQIVEQFGTDRAFKQSREYAFSSVSYHNQIGFYFMSTGSDLNSGATKSDAGADTQALPTKIMNSGVQGLPLRQLTRRQLSWPR